MFKRVMSLIYFISSLPFLNFDEVPTLSTAKFEEMCRDHLNKADASAACALLYGQASEQPFVAAWRDKDAILRNAVARQRARSSGGDASRWLHAVHGCDKRIEAGVEDAFQETDPLKKEKALDRLRWTVIEELQGCDPLNIRVIFAYALKLALATRWASLDKKQGQTVFDRLAESTPSFSTPNS